MGLIFRTLQLLISELKMSQAHTIFIFMSRSNSSGNDSRIMALYLSCQNG